MSNINILAEVQTLAVPDPSVLSTGANAALRMAQSFVITTDDDYALAGDELKSVKARINSLEDKRTGITGPLNKVVKAVNDLFRGPMETLKSAEEAIKGSMLAYSQEQERKAAEARRVAEEAAAAERARIEEEARQREAAAEAERQRMAREEADRQDAARAEQERLEHAAAEAAAAGDTEAAERAAREAEEKRQADELADRQADEREQQAREAAEADVAALRMTAAVISAPVVPISRAKAAGTSVAKTVDYEVTNLHALVKHIAENPALVSLVMADNVKLRAYVRGLGMNTDLPGVRVFEKRSLSSRAA